MEYALQQGISWIWQRTLSLSVLLREELGKVDGVTVQDLGRNLCGIVSFSKV